MAVSAAIKFTQGVTTAPAGQALMGVAGQAVVASNGNDGDVMYWEWEVLGAPGGSTLLPGVKSQGGVATYAFTPDVAGGYSLKLTVRDKYGAQAEDTRVFQVPEATGRIIPPFGAAAKALNFAGQLLGWHPYMEQWLRYLDTGVGDPVVYALATDNQALTGLPTIDNLSVPAGKLVCLAGNTNGVENGLWVTSAGAWSRAVLATGRGAAGVRVWVDRGQFQQGTRWECKNLVGADVVGTNALTFKRSGARLGDIPFDSDDVGYWCGAESGSTLTFPNLVPGGASLPLTAHNNGSNLAYAASEILPGLFGGSALQMSFNTRGLYGASAAVDVGVAVPFHMSLFFKPLMSTIGTGSGTAEAIVGRTKLATLTNYNAANIAFALRGNRLSNNYGDGSGGDFYRRLLIDVNIAGTFQTLDYVRASVIEGWAAFPGMWFQYDVSYDPNDGFYETRMNAMQTNKTVSGQMPGSGAGYIFVGSPFVSGAFAVVGFPMVVCGVRLRKAKPSLAWVQERWTRSRGWV